MRMPRLGQPAHHVVVIGLGVFLQPRGFGVAEVGQGCGQGVEAPDGVDVGGQPVPVVLHVFQPAGGQESGFDRRAAVLGLRHRGLPLASHPIAGLDQLRRGLLHPLAVARKPPVIGHIPHHVAVVFVIADVLVSRRPHRRCRPSF